MSELKTDEREQRISVPCTRIACNAGGKIGLDISVTSDGELFVWCYDPTNGPHGIKIPIGRVVDALHLLIDAEFERGVR